MSVGAVLYLDLNNFNSINDRFGHQAGDEFAIVLPDVNLDDIRHIGQRLVQSSSEAYIIQGQEIKCTASVGIALMPKHGEELWHLLSIADQAMYCAKKIPEEEAANDRAAYVDAATAS